MVRTYSIIDAHAMLGEETYLALDADELCRRMDGAGIDVAVARPMGRGLIVDHRAGNDMVLAAGPRVRGMVSANPWWGDKALDELARARDHGAVGMFLDPARQGFMPTEAVARPMFERAAEYGWPVMVKTGTYVNADVLALAEVARSLPETPFIAGFGGFADMWFELAGIFGATANLYLDASMMWGDAVADVLRSHGPSRVLFGGAEPRNRYAVNLRTIDRLNLDEEAKRAVLFDNAKRLFKL